jgi:hypothetical protein
MKYAANEAQKGLSESTTITLLCVWVVSGCVVSGCVVDSIQWVWGSEWGSIKYIVYSA